MGKLFVVPTPIGNLEDMTYRAVRVLGKVELIAAEDTRVTRKLLDHFGIKTPMVAYFEHNELAQMKRILEELESGDVALVSDAGTPGISDPGYKLIREVLRKNFEVVPLPGPTALIPALVGSGLPTDGFLFLGFLPKKQSGRLRVLKEVREQKRTLIFYESAFRLRDSLADALEVLGERRICIAREISKKFEEFIRTSMSNAIEALSTNRLAGEVIVVVEGKKQRDEWSDEKIKRAVRESLKRGFKYSQAVKQVAKESGKKRSAVYELGMKQSK